MRRHLVSTRIAVRRGRPAVLTSIEGPRAALPSSWKNSHQRFVVRGRTDCANSSRKAVRQGNSIRTGTRRRPGSIFERRALLRRGTQNPCRTLTRRPTVFRWFHRRRTTTNWRSVLATPPRPSAECADTSHRARSLHSGCTGRASAGPPWPKTVATGFVSAINVSFLNDRSVWCA